MSLDIPRFLGGGVTVRTIREGIETVETLRKGETVADTTPKKRGRPRKDAQATSKPQEKAKRRGRPPKAANGSLDGLLTQLRAEREKYIDKVAALGTAIDALEAA